jgi:hypothetical protein
MTSQSVRQDIREEIERESDTHTNIHASSGIRTHDPSVSAGEDRAATMIGYIYRWLVSLSVDLLAN